MEKSGEKHRRLSIEDIAPTPTADAANESNVEDQYFAFLFDIASLLINS